MTKLAVSGREFLVLGLWFMEKAESGRKMLAAETKNQEHYPPLVSLFPPSPAIHVE
jgi:hypothetical protein